MCPHEPPPPPHPPALRPCNTPHQTSQSHASGHPPKRCLEAPNRSRKASSVAVGLCRRARGGGWSFVFRSVWSPVAPRINAGLPTPRLILLHPHACACSPHVANPPSTPQHTPAGGTRSGSALRPQRGPLDASLLNYSQVRRPSTVKVNHRPSRRPKGAKDDAVGYRRHWRQNATRLGHSGGSTPDLLRPPTQVTPHCESNALFRTTRGGVSAPFGTTEFGGFIFWWSVKIKFSLSFGAGDGISGTLIASRHFWPLPSVHDAAFSTGL